MIDITQFILISVVVSLTVVLIVIGIQTVAILKEFRNTVSKINKILEDTGLITESVAKPISVASGFLVGLKSRPLLQGVLKVLKKRSKKEKVEEE